MVSYDKDYFNGKGYGYYCDFPSHRIRAEHLVKMLHPKSVLDVGCAYGFTVYHLGSMGIEAQGCDISEYAGQKANEIIPGRWKQVDIRNGLPYKDKEFDVLYCEGVLEHIEEDKIEFIMREFERVSERRVLQISLSEHSNAAIEEGHINLHDNNWWFQRIPINTYLALQSATETNYAWLFKG